MRSIRSVGLIGLGALGRPIAVRVGREFPLLVTSRTRPPDQFIESMKAEWRPTPKDVASSADLILLVLPNDEATRLVVADETEGIFAASQRCVSIVNISTTQPSLTEELARESRKRGHSWIDAPVAGTVTAAENGQLLTMAAGAPETIDEASAVLSCYSAHVCRVGAIPNGSIVKLLNNLVLTATVQSLGEALALGEVLHIDIERILEVFELSPIASRALIRKGELMRRNNFEPQARLGILAKDMRYLAETALRAEVTLPTAANLLQFLERGLANGLGDRDFSVMIEQSRRDLRGGEL